MVSIKLTEEVWRVKVGVDGEGMGEDRNTETEWHINGLAEKDGQRIQYNCKRKGEKELGVGGRKEEERNTERKRWRWGKERGEREIQRERGGGGERKGGRQKY